MDRTGEIYVVCIKGKFKQQRGNHNLDELRQSPLRQLQANIDFAWLRLVAGAFAYPAVKLMSHSGHLGRRDFELRHYP